MGTEQTLKLFNIINLNKKKGIDMVKFFILSFLFFFFPLLSFALNEFSIIDLIEEPCKIWLEIKEEKDFILVKTCGENKGEEKVFYKIFLEITKSGKSGKSSSKQSDNIVLNPEEEKCFSQSKLNLIPGDEYSIVAKLYKNNILIKEKGIEKKVF